MATAASAWQLLPGCSSSPGSSRPNLLFILADAHRASTVGCYGDRFAITPHMDALATDGLRLTTAVSNTPLCRPYRASLMTGALGHHCGLVGNWSEHNQQDTLTEDFAMGTMPRGRQWTPDGLPTLGSTFAAAGYRCGYVGKWHLGRVDVDPGPLRMGFDDHWAVSSEPAHEYWDWSYFTGAGASVEGHDLFKPTVDTDLAIEFLDRADERPWCLMLSWAGPHQPFEPPARFRHFNHVQPAPNVPAGKRPNLAGYYGMIEAIDHELGRVLAALQQRGLAGNTIVVYTADHGTLLGSHGTGGKELPYDGSTRVPFIARWPGHIPGGTTLTAPVGTPDIMPSLTGLAGLQVPSVPDGLDLSALLLGGSEVRSEPAVYLANYVGNETKDKPAWRGLRSERHLFACTEQGPWLLYDLLDDPHELTNLVEAGDPLAAQLHARTLDTMSALGDTWLA
jgi:arylsulfatase A-like enzyme